MACILSVGRGKLRENRGHVGAMVLDRPLAAFLSLGLAILMLGSLALEQHVQRAPLLGWGSRGPQVEAVQQCLDRNGYDPGRADGTFDRETWLALREFQEHRGLPGHGIVTGQTWEVLTTYEPAVPAQGGQVIYRSDVVDLLARLIMGEAEGESFLGKVAVGAVILNRIKNAAFPSSLAGVVYQPLAFESVAKGTIWKPVTGEARRAAEQCLAGWDPTHGAIYFWNPSKPVNPWVWTRNIITQIGHHVFAR